MRAQIQEIINRLQEAAQQLSWPNGIMHETLHGIADDLEAAIRPQWVPVAERLPDEGVECFVAIGETVTQGYWYATRGIWLEVSTGDLLTGVTHWQQIDYPEPPESLQ